MKGHPLTELSYFPSFIRKPKPIPASDDHQTEFQTGSGGGEFSIQGQDLHGQGKEECAGRDRLRDELWQWAVEKAAAQENLSHVLCSVV